MPEFGKIFGRDGARGKDLGGLVLPFSNTMFWLLMKNTLGTFRILQLLGIWHFFSVRLPSIRHKIFAPPPGIYASDFCSLHPHSDLNRLSK